MKLACLTDPKAGSLGLSVPDDLPFFPGMGLMAALARFEFTLSLLQTTDAVRRVASEMCEDAAVEGITTLEIRFAPQLHGDPLEAYIDAALEGIDGRAGLRLRSAPTPTLLAAERMEGERGRQWLLRTVRMPP